MTRTPLAAALTLAFAITLATIVTAAVDVSGTWKVDGDVVGNAINFTCTLKQSGETLTGKATLLGKEVPVTGTVKGTTVSFQFDVEYQGNTYTDVFTGPLSDKNDSIDGKIEVAGVEGVFSAKKQ
jgi:hypothetical protein